MGRKTIKQDPVPCKGRESRGPAGPLRLRRPGTNRIAENDGLRIRQSNNAGTAYRLPERDLKREAV